MALIQLINVTKTYTRRQAPFTALQELSLQIEAGTFLVLHGPSGSGKTTLLSLVGGLDRPSSGEVEVAGVELSSMNDHDLSAYRNRTVGFIFQSFNLQVRQTILRNVAMPLIFSGAPRGERQRRAEAALAAVDITERLDQRVMGLSAGQQQRVAIARAIVNEPKILVADEPTGNLDRETGRRIIERLRRINEDSSTTIVMATHDEEVVRHADRGIHLQDGKILDDAGRAHAPDR